MSIKLEGKQVEIIGWVCLLFFVMVALVLFFVDPNMLYGWVTIGAAIFFGGIYIIFRVAKGY